MRAHGRERRNSRSSRTAWYGVAAGAMLCAGMGVAHAAAPEDFCQYGRAVAASKYAQCAQKAQGKYLLTYSLPSYVTAAEKCVTKYALAWPALQAKWSGTTCGHSRFADNGDGTVSDRLTGLQWEKKTTDGTIHDENNVYSWTAGGPNGSAADGDAFTTFLATLDGGGCFAGQCDWRLPTRDELLTIVTSFPACVAPGPCIDPAFGPTPTVFYWSATSLATAPEGAWGAFFDGSNVTFGAKFDALTARAVRGGL